VVGVTSRSPIERQTPAQELERFDQFCEDRPVSVHEAATQAVLEFLPREFVPSGYRTDGHDLEEQLAEDLRHAELLGNSSMKKPRLEENRRDVLAEQETQKCRIHIDDPLLEALEKYVISEEGKARGEVGVYFAEALSEYRDGGQSGRIQEWYARLRDNMTFLPEDRETRTQQIVNEVEAQLDERDQDYVHQRTIDSLTRELTDAEVDKAIREYRQRVLDELDFVDVSTGREVYAPPEVAEEMEADHAMDEIEPAQYEAMDRDGRVEHLRAALRQRAEANGGADSLTYTDVIEKVFAGVDGPSHNYAYTLMDEAAEASGFRYGEHNGQRRLRFNENWVGESAADETQPVDDTPDEWLSVAVEESRAVLEELPDEYDHTDSVIRKKVDKAQHPAVYDRLSAEDVRDPEGHVDPDDVELVKKRLDQADEQADQEADRRAEAESELERIAEAKLVATDGGRPADTHHG
jgi:hypothetical protein